MKDMQMGRIREINTAMKARTINGDECFKIIEADGEQYALNSDEVEYYLTRFIKMKNQLKKEKNLRKRYDFVQMKFLEYQTALALCKGMEKRKT